jgi:hypothetical protein
MSWCVNDGDGGLNDLDSGLLGILSIVEVLSQGMNKDF